jgi:imidazolonepropionase
MYADKVIVNISKLYTPKGPFVRGSKMNDITKYDEAFIAIKDGLILDVGDHDYSIYVGEHTDIIDGRRLVALPGFVDSHTHLVYGGSREHEFSKKLQGVPYLDILKAGGGILSTVEATREIDYNALLRKSAGSLYELGSYGVTTVEVKSGYGLNRETEEKQLRIIQELNKKTPFDVVGTYLGAHAFPKKYKNNKDGYIEELLQDIEYIKENNLATFIDVFCEDSVFNYNQSKRILEKGKEVGLKIKIHADEIVSLGGAGLAVELGANSADHLMAISDKDIESLAKSNTVANLLPSTSFYLGKDYAPARKLIEKDAIVSISSDMNPGSSPNENFQFVQQLGCLRLKMTPEEVLTATTINSAFNLGLQDQVGSLEIGKKADILLMDAPNLEYIFYHFGINHVKDILKNGKVIFHNRRYV